MKDIKINTYTKADHEIVINILGLYGYKVFDHSPMERYSDRSYEKYPNLVLNRKRKEVTGDMNKDYHYSQEVYFWPKDCGEVMTLLCDDNLKKTITLDGEEVIITPDNVVYKHFTISKETINTLKKELDSF